MPTYNGRTVVLMPTTGPTPKSLEPLYKYASGRTPNDFNLTVQVYDWAAHRMGMSVTMPPMVETDAINWVNFLISLNGTTNVFQITDATWLARIPASASVTGYWSLIKPDFKWSVNDGIIYGLEFEIEEVK